MQLVDLDDRPELKQLNFRNALVIEEAEVFRSGIVQFLRKEGWIVHGVRRAEQALPLLAHIPYHLIVIDSELPGITGIDFRADSARLQGMANDPISHYYQFTNSSFQFTS
jgi:CheY-like chemotaxis protein